ncbi:MAG: VIT1/CCC1 transporter family protein [Roseibium album]|uniref:VIT1/CCC1 transporter family protein n=1 Tax=Stappiaceae TaxID=2821832 RepID=UPI00048DDBB1|nr:MULTISPECIES: VIT1/CCC1 transporter family protein [Stappiaceae]MBG6161020.1 VIT1/CCC1 family predicted Fe2+/Mn2+ transporter [Labrenzia sp. EL_195]
MPTPRLEHSHRPDDIASRLAVKPTASYLRDWIYGGIDGAVTTFAIVAGAVGAALSPKIILILGVANLLADGFSMAAANYSGSKSETEDYARLMAIEEKHIAVAPEGEKEEIRQIFRSKGYQGSDLDDLVRLVTSNRTTWIETMMQSEYGLSAATRSPFKAALATFAAFVVCGSLPLLPFLMGLGASEIYTTALTALTFFLIGSIKSHWSTKNWVWSGLETTGIGLSAAAIAYFVGYLLQGLIA